MMLESQWDCFRTSNTAPGSSSFSLSLHAFYSTCIRLHHLFHSAASRPRSVSSQTAFEKDYFVDNAPVCFEGIFICISESGAV